MRSEIVKKSKLFVFLLVCVMICGLSQPAFAAVSDTGFSDVAAGVWYADAVTWCRENGIMSGTSATAFSPEASMSRAMFATVLYRAEGEPAVTGIDDFTDTEAGRWYSNAVLWASQQKLVEGYGNGRFGTNDTVTREQFATILWRYVGRPSASSAAFADDASISGWAKDAVSWARANAIISGVGNNRFDPKGSATRAQAAAILSRSLPVISDKWKPAEEEEPSDDSGASPEETPETNPGTRPVTPGDHSKILVAYFSRAGENYSVGTVSEGNTAIVAEIIAAQTGGDLFEIVPVTPYPSNYSEMLTIATNEKNSGARPAIANKIANLSEYDTVFVGYPIWHADMPMIVYNFLESYDFSGKTVIPFNTHEGSGQAGTQSRFATKLPGSTVPSGLAIRGNTAQNDRSGAEQAVKTWLDGLGLSKTEASVSTTSFDLTSGTVKLNNGRIMPILGIGTYQLSDSQAENSVYWALKAGYRLIDTARIYGNEEGVGRGIQRAISEGICKREDIFVTTKMWTSDYGNGAAAIDASLQRLGLDYIDLMILHHSQPSNDVQAYQAMEQAVANGKLRSIGLSNYYTPGDFDRLVNATTIKPALLQNETHPYHQSTEMKEHLVKFGTVLESWYPLGGRGHTATLFNDSVISGIAAAHGKTSAQVILRWHLQAGNIAIPGSSNEDHIQENFDIFDFSLTDAEMAQIKALDKNQRFSTY